LKEEVLGTQVDVKLRLHQGLKFRNEDGEFLKERASLFQKNVGNVTAKTELTFEYELRADEELMEFGVDPTKMESVPFQAQIIYTSTNGDKLLRVITQKLKTTDKLEEAEQHMKVNVLATRAIQHQAHSASRGNYGHSEKVGQRWGNYFNSKPLNKGSEEVISNYQAKNMRLQNVAGKQAKKKELSKPQSEEKGFLGKVADFFQSKKEVASPSKDDKVKPESPVLQRKSSLVRERSYDNLSEDEDFADLHEAKNCNFDDSL